MGNKMPGQTDQKSAPEAIITEQLSSDIASEAYIYGFPLVLMDVTRRISTNVSRPGENAAPINQLGHKRSFPDDTFTTVVTPNADTLYSFAFLDLAKGPIVLSLPEMGDRYYLMQMLDAWTNVFAAPGTRTTGNGKGDFAVAGPGWNGKLPQDVKELRSPTNLVWMIGRTQTNGEKDYTAVRAIQDKYKLTPLSAWGKAYTPPDNVPVDKSIDMETPPVKQTVKLDTATFFARLNALMKDNPPAVADAEALQRFAALDIVPGKQFDLKQLDPAVARGLAQGVDLGRARIIAEARKPHGKVVNGWEFMTNIGRFGTDYLWRAVVALVGLGANLPEDAIYPRRTVDADQQTLTGANQYAIRFAKDQLPPVGAFWSISMYNSRQAFVKNPINRHAIGDRDDLKFAADGSLTLYIQNESPGKDAESNWLPAPKDAFNLFMRLYWPKNEVLDGSWKPPQVRNLAEEAEQVA
jgi:hypothetical protein